MRDIYGATADAPAFRDAFARWLGALWSDGTEATLAPLSRVTGAPQPGSSSSTATACSSTASRSRCACCSTPSPAPGSSLDARRGRRALPRPLARLDPRDRRPRLRPHRHRRRPRRHAPRASTPPSAPSSSRSPASPRPSTRCPAPTASPPPRSPSGSSSRSTVTGLWPRFARPRLLRDHGGARQARPRPLLARRRGPSATLPPPAWWSRTARPASWRRRPPACGWWPSPGEAMRRATSTAPAWPRSAPTRSSPTCAPCHRAS